MTYSRLIVVGLCALALASGCDDKAKTETPTETTATETTAAETTAEAPETTPTETTPEDDKGGSVELTEDGTKWIKSTTYQVKFSVPEDWEVTIEPDGVSATDSDETTTVVVVGSESHSMMAAAIQDVQKKVKIKDAKIDDTKQTVLNGFAGQNVRGTAVLEKSDGLDQEIQFIAYNVRVNKDTVVTMMIFSEAEMYEAKKEIIEGLANTLTKI